MINKKEWINSNEGSKLLKMDRQRFFYYVESRNIRTKPGETKRKTEYNYKDIMDLRADLGIGRSPDTIVDWVEPSDITSTLALDYLIYQEAILGDLNLYISWVKRNDKITLASFDASDRRNVLAYITILPIKEEHIIKILKGEIKETDIVAKDIELYNRKGGYTLLVESAACHPDHPEKLAEVIRHLLDYWNKQYPDRYIEKIYAQAASEKGDILIQKLFFAPLYDMANDAYVLDMKRPGASKLIRNFQQSLKAKENQAIDIAK